jgi:hypothetical protein
MHTCATVASPGGEALRRKNRVYQDESRRSAGDDTEEAGQHVLSGQRYPVKAPSPRDAKQMTSIYISSFPFSQSCISTTTSHSPISMSASSTSQIGWVKSLRTTHHHALVHLPGHRIPVHPSRHLISAVPSLKQVHLLRSFPYMPDHDHLMAMLYGDGFDHDASLMADPAGQLPSPPLFCTVCIVCVATTSRLKPIAPWFSRCQGSP